MKNLLDILSFRLAPEDEYPHAVDDAKNFNESMYINVFDFNQTMGGWFRVGNRPNEGKAEVSCCIYLPDGRVGFMFSRPGISSNDALDAAGLKFEIIEPLKASTGNVFRPGMPLDQSWRHGQPGQGFLGKPHRGL